MAYTNRDPSLETRETTRPRLIDLCRGLESELEVLANVLYLVRQRELAADEYKQYLAAATGAIDRIRKILLKNC